MVVLNDFNLYSSQMRAEYCVFSESCLMVGLTDSILSFPVFLWFLFPGCLFEGIREGFKN